LKSAKIHPITRRFGHEDLVKTKLSNNNVKRARIKLSITFLNFKIAPLEINILIFKTLFSIYIQNATSFGSDKKFSDAPEISNQ
jgi:hypothetical protein